MSQRLGVSALLLTALLVGCSTSGLSGKYLTGPDSGYGWEFDGGTVYSLLGNEQARGTYEVDGETVRVCIGTRCAEMRIEGGCVIQPTPGGRYCKEWPQPAAPASPGHLAGLSCGELRVMLMSSTELVDRMDAYIEQTIRCGIVTPAP